MSIELIVGGVLVLLFVGYFIKRKKNKKKKQVDTLGYTFIGGTPNQRDIFQKAMRYIEIRNSALHNNISMKLSKVYFNDGHKPYELTSLMSAPKNGNKINVWKPMYSSRYNVQDWAAVIIHEYAHMVGHVHGDKMDAFVSQLRRSVGINYSI